MTSEDAPAGKIVLGATEKVVLFSPDGTEKEVVAKIDTGASKSSIDTTLAAELRLGPIHRTKIIKSAHGIRLRPVIHAKILLKGKVFNEEFTLADRSHLKYDVLIGNNILKKGFLVDPSKEGK